MFKLKNLFIIASSLTLIGIVGSFATYKFVPKPDVMTEEIASTDFTNIEVAVDNGKIELMSTNDKNARIEVSGYHLKNNFSMTVEDAKLSLVYKDQTKKFYNFGLTQQAPLIKVYIPEKEYHTINANAKNGKVIAENITVNALNLNANNGSIHLKNSHSNELIMNANNGKMTVDSITGTTLKLQADNGRILLNQIDSETAELVSHNGKIEATDITGALLAKANNGGIILNQKKLDASVDFTAINGKIQIKTSQKPTDTIIDAQAQNGSITIFGEKNSHAIFGNGENKINLTADNGRIRVE